MGSKNESSSVVSAVMVEPSSTPRSVPEGIITNTPPHTPYQRRSSNGSIKRLSFESGLSKCDESMEEETTETTNERSQGEDVPKKRDSKVRFQAANIDVVDEKEDRATESEMDVETMSALASLTSAAVGGGGADGGTTTTTTTTPTAAAVVGKKKRNNSSSFVELSTVLSKLTPQMEADQLSSEERAQRTDAHVLRLQEEATAQQNMMVQ